MRLSAKPIINWCNINDFAFANQWIIRTGEPNTLYFQLVDLDNNSLRYLAGIGSSNQPYGINVIFPSVDDTQAITVAAVQADVNDSSVWKVTLSGSQTPGSGNVKFAITEGSVTRHFSLMAGLSVEDPLNDGSC